MLTYRLVQNHTIRHSKCTGLIRTLLLHIISNKQTFLEKHLGYISASWHLKGALVDPKTTYSGRGWDGNSHMGHSPATY